MTAGPAPHDSPTRVGKDTPNVALKGLIVYFSQSGATARVAEAVAHGLRTAVIRLTSGT
jgi:hypothetical protein